MLRFRGLTLIVAALTLVLTILLYLAIPKGFLPDQDTGFLTVDTVTAPDVSFDRMKALQNSVEEVIRKDPDVLGTVSVVGTGTTNATQNVAHFALTLKPKNERRASATEIMQRLTTAAREIPGIYTTFQIVQDIQIGTSRSSTQYQYVLVGLDREGFSEWAKKLTNELKQDSRLSHVSSDVQEDGNAVMINIDRVIAWPPRRHHAGAERHALRRVRPAAGLDDIRPVEPVPPGAGGRSADQQERSSGAWFDLRSGQRHQRLDGGTPPPALPAAARAARPARR